MATKSVFQKVVILTVIASFVVWNMAAVAAPEGGQVAAGNAAITQSGTTTTINQSSQNTVINWQGFNTTANEAVKFIQPNASSIALNRITSGLPTSYAGQLTANGQVWILNPAGVLFTPTSKIDVGGLVATTLSIKDSDFMNKSYKLFQSPDFPQGSVINYGSITSHENGLVALVAPTVENHGTIVANVGNVLLASGTVATIDPYGDNLINFAPDNYAIEGSVTNTGTISANGGKVVMAANSVNKIIKNVVNAGGIIEAKNIRQGADGVIILGGNSGTTNVTGKITSSRIMIKGHDTVVTGELKSPVEGGFIETSGETVDVSKAILDPGKGGLWYLDPLTIDIAAQYGNVIQNLLQAGTSVTLSTGVSLATGGTGIIFANQPITWNTSAALTLMAYSSIFVTAPIVATNGSSALILHADTGQVNGTVSFSGAGSVNTSGVAIIYYHPGDYASPTNFAPFFPTNQPTAFMTINNLSNLNSVYTNPAGNYLLNADIDALSIPGNSFFPAVFSGIFDGHDYMTGGTHAISNVYVNSILAGYPYVGGLVSENTGTIENLIVKGIVNGDNTNWSGVGGIAGYSSGTITKTVFNSTYLSSINNSNAGTGGIVGVLDGGSVTESGSTGFVGGAGGTIGGVVGISYGGTITNVYSWMNNINGSNRGGILGTIGSGNTVMHNVYFAGSASGMDAFIGNNYGGASWSLSGFFDYDDSQCSGCSHSYPGGLSAGYPTSQMFNLNFGSPWTAPTGSSYPTIIQINTASNLVLLSGSLSSPAVQTVSLYGGNNFMGNFSTNASGNFGFQYNPDTSVYGFYLATTNGGTVKGAILKTTDTTVPVTNLNITNNLVMVDGASGFSNANLAVATSNAPYTVSGNNLTLSSGVSFLATAITPFTLNGNITTSGAGTITFNNTVSLTTASVLTSAGLIDFTSTVNGGFALTANTSGAVIFGGDVGGITSLASLIVSSNGPIIPAGFIRVAGASSFTAGANPITLTDLGNVFGGAVTLVNSGANDVQIYNNAPLTLTTFNLGRNLTASTSGGAITLNGANTSGGSQTYNAPVLIGSATSLTSTNGNIDFTSTVDGGFALTANASGAVFFGGPVGGSTALTGLTVLANSAFVPADFIKVTGASSFTTGANLIDLSNPNNTFSGPISLNATGSNDATLVNSIGTVLDTSSVGGVLTVTSNGPISQTGVLTVGGASSFSAGANGINLNLANVLTGPVSFTNTGAGNNVTLNNTTALILGTSSTDGNLIVTSNGNAISQTGPLTVGGTSSFTAGAAAITLTDLGNDFQGQVTLSNSGANDVQIYNADPLDLAPFTVGGSLIVTTDGSNIILHGANTSGGAQTYNDPIVLGSSTSLTATSGNIDFTNTIAGAGFNLTTSTAPTYDTQIHGDITNVNVLTVNGDVDINANVSTIGAQTYNGLVTLTTDANLVNTVGNINFISGIDGDGYSLSTTTASPFATVFDGAVSNVDVLSVTGTTDINGGSIATLGEQLYNGLVNLGTNTDLASTGGNIEFFNIVDAFGFDLTTHTVDPYSTIFHSNPANINNLTVDGEATFPVAIVITATGTASFNDALNGPGSLTLTAANTLIGGTEGGVPPLSFLTINGPVSFNGGVINADTQTYNGLVTVLSSANPTEMNASGLIHFLNDVEGPGGLILVASNVQFDGDVGGITELSLLDITAPVNFTGSSTFNAAIQNYRGPVTISGAGAIINGSGSVNFFDTVDGPGSLTVNAPVTQFSGIVGGTSPLNILTILNDVILNGVTIYANQQIYQGPATIGAGGANLISPDVQFLSTISGPGALGVIGDLTASGDINIRSLSVTGTTLYNKGTDQNVTTVNGQNYGDTVTLNNNLNILNTGFGYINFGGGGVYGPTFDLSVFNMSWTITNGITGSVNVNSLTLGGTGGANLTNSFFNSLQYSFLSVGSFCVNGSCEAINLNGPEAQRFILPENNMVCDASGCSNVFIEISDLYLLRAFDPLREICVVGVDGTVSCLGGSEEE